ncbi:permease component of ribose/xylose/arabinose/galactoside ABC-type transporters [Sphaerochaeta pleomorpha str. Grapes]|uniref:Permease component of ribose/xylose/arabinose/galactoside ABC-type transporters n=1 Tax=Sphaerochaeta pleomorpha (strain ATCC BAA-1885 / DSM 22778 / Grapes) TaxID=158190 RepID=G8QQL8_SPHPG|nr:ABC transporter permease [Sphaerochaeta pleomorpha]AEV30948.1 permease component of ribose/xylose/arabinose/galactoside ABC-type transporters [Sphaerochaeta pleomorpha str. Grapes]
MKKITMRTSLGIKEFVRSYGTILALIAIIIVFGSLKPDTFFSKTNFWNITRQMAILAVIALGTTLIMCVEEFDLSVGTIASFSGVCAAVLAISGVPFFWALVVSVIASAILGFLNGYIVTKFRVMSFIITLAMSRVIYGITYWLSGGAIIFNGIPEAFKFIGTAKIGPIPYLTVLMVIVSALFYYVTKSTAFGRKLYAIGGNERASQVAGIQVSLNKTLAFTISGAMAGFAGVLLASRVGSAAPTAGDAYCLNAYATIFIGKTLFKEGVPNIVGTIVGVAIFTVLANGLTIMQVPTFFQNILTGGIIVLAVVAQKLGSKDHA